MRSNVLLSKTGSLIRNYGFSIVSTAVALGLSLATQSLGVEKLGFPLFLATIAMTVWYAGNGPGVLAVVLSTLAYDYFFTPPLHTFGVEQADRPYIVGFVLFGLITAGFSSRRRTIEHKLRKARDALAAEVVETTRQASLLDLTHDTIFVRDMNDVITYWNRGAQELFGWAARDAIGREAHKMLSTIFPRPLDEIHSILNDSGRWEGELGKTKSNGTPVTVASRWSLQRDEAGRPTAILETNNDITERKRREEEIRRLNADLERRTIELQASNKELEAFSYSTAHDLRAPLRHIAGYTELLQKNAVAVLDEKCRRYVLMILESASRMGTLIDDLLAFSRIGRVQTQDTLVSMTQLAQEILGEFERETDGRDIAWKLGALPCVHGDRSLLRIVLVNLLENAIKFTRTREKAEIEIGSRPGAPGEVVVFVKDNGVGFDMKYVGKLFGVFQRLHGPEAFEGTGIGLATVQRIVARHGGRAWAESEDGRGATFYFSAPHP